MGDKKKPEPNLDAIKVNTDNNLWRIGRKKPIRSTSEKLRAIMERKK